MMFKKVAIIGTGLIGGSLGLAIKKNRLANCIVGVSHHQKSIAFAKKIRAIDCGSVSLGIIKGADLVILATPPDTIIKLAPRIIKLTGKNCLVTDVASTKGEIVARLEKIFPNYIGSHPMAGSEKRSVLNAAGGLFKNSLCILTPTRKTKPLVLRKLKLFWHKLGVRTICLNPRSHDEILAFVSHLPHVLAFSLIDVVPQEYLKFASGGLKDTTRIAASDSALWSDIFIANRRNILKSISLFRRRLAVMESALNSKNKKQMIQVLKKAGAKRESLG